MKLNTVKKRFISSKSSKEKGLKFWKESIKSIKKMFWHAGEFHSTPSHMIRFCDATNEVVGVDR